MAGNAGGLDAGWRLRVREPEGSMSMNSGSGAFPVQTAGDDGFLRARRRGALRFPKQKR